MSRFHENDGTQTLTYTDALSLIRDSVRRRDKLIHGKLRDHGEYCALGAFFHDNRHLILPDNIIEEVAAYNDSIPVTASEQERQRKVLAWLNFKLFKLKLRKMIKPLNKISLYKTKGT